MFRGIYKPSILFLSLPTFLSPPGQNPVSMRNKQHLRVNQAITEKTSTFTTAYIDNKNMSADYLKKLKKHLYESLISLDGVSQSSRYHPEGDALYHSLQVFQLARRACDIPELWAAALLHDIGKAVNTPLHAKIGADDLEGLLSPRIVWLVRHHLHLLVAPKRTRRWLRNKPQLRELELLRAWDLKGRSPSATVIAPIDAIDILMKHTPSILFCSDAADYYENKELG